MDKRVKAVIASLFLSVLLVGCMEEKDIIPDLDVQEILDQEGIEDIRYNGEEGDTTGGPK